MRALSLREKVSSLSLPFLEVQIKKKEAFNLLTSKLAPPASYSQTVIY